MKAINNFFNKAAYWKVYLFAIIFIGVSVYFMFTFLGMDSHLTKTPPKLQIAAVFGLSMGAFFTISVKMGRDSKRFWELASEFEEVIYTAKTKEELKELSNNYLVKLRDVGSGNYHDNEIHRLMSMVRIKNETLK